MSWLLSIIHSSRDVYNLVQHVWGVRWVQYEETRLYFTWLSVAPSDLPSQRQSRAGWARAGQAVCSTISTVSQSAQSLLSPGRQSSLLPPDNNVTTTSSCLLSVDCTDCLVSRWVVLSLTAPVGRWDKTSQEAGHLTSLIIILQLPIVVNISFIELLMKIRIYFCDQD